jgi:hypothetical protein
MQKETISRYLKLRFADTKRSREAISMVLDMLSLFAS